MKVKSAGSVRRLVLSRLRLRDRAKMLRFNLKKWEEWPQSSHLGLGSREKLCNSTLDISMFIEFTVFSKLGWCQHGVETVWSKIRSRSIHVYSVYFPALHITALNILNITLNRGDSRLSMALAVTWHIPCGSTTARWEQTRLLVQAVSETSFWKQCCQRKDFPSLQIMCLYRYTLYIYIYTHTMWPSKHMYIDVWGYVSMSIWFACHCLCGACVCL